jgi:hypothetical protein
MKKKFEHKERKGLPGGPNEMFTYVTSVFDIYQAPSNIEGQGMFAGKPFKKGDLIGLAHSNGQPASQLGRMHNHDENSPTMISKKSGNDRFVFAAKDLQPGDELTTNYRMQPELEQPEDFQYGGSVMAPPRKGVRKNPDGSESTHLMATETFDGKNWFSFPTLFQDPDGTWIDMSDRPWQEAYEEAKRRGEVIDFGTDKEAAIKFGEGSWKKQMGGSILPPAIRNMYPTEDTPIYGGIVGESTVTAPRAGKPSISDFIEYRKQTGEAIPESSAYHYSHRPQPMDSNFSFIGADKSGGLGALKAIGKGVKGLLGLRGAADDVAKGFNYRKGFGNPYEKLNVTDDMFKGPVDYGVDYTGEIAKGRLDFVRNLGKELDDINFDAGWITPEHLKFHGSPSGRSVVEVALPGKTHQTQLFYKSSGLAGKSGQGVKGTTQGLWQPYGGHATLLHPQGPVHNWFIKDHGYENFYNSKSFKDVANRLDDLTKEAGFDLSGQAYKYQNGGEAPNGSNLYPLNAQGIPMDMLDEVTVTGDRFQEKWWSPANLLTFGLINGTKRRLTRNIHPFGYDGLDKITDALFYPDKPIDWPDSMLERNPELAGKTEADMKKESIQRQQAKVANDPSVPGSALMERQQLFQYMMGQDASQYEGIPLSGEGYGLRTSKYKPTDASNPNAYYFRSPATEYEIKDQFNNNQDIKDWMASQTKDKLLTNGAVLGNYHLTKGEDDKGKYVSYYDIWDLDPFKTGSSESGSGLDYDIPSEIPLIGGMQVNANTLNWLSDKFQQWGNVNPGELYGRVYYTENPDGTINVLDEKQDGGEASKIAAQQATGYRPQATISQYEEPAWYEKAANYLASPMTSLGYLVRGEDLPDRIPINAENRNTYDMAFDIINPAAWAAYAESADKNLEEGNYLAAGFDAMAAIPVIPSSVSQGSKVVKATKGAPQLYKRPYRALDEMLDMEGASSFITEKPMTFTHTSKNPALSLDDIKTTEAITVGKRPKAGKRIIRDIESGVSDPRNAPAGFYTVSPEAGVRSTFAGYGSPGSYRYSFEMPAGSRVLDFPGGTSVMSTGNLQEALDMGYDVIRGNDMGVGVEFLPLNKSKMSGFRGELIKKYGGSLPKAQNGLVDLLNWGNSALGGSDTYWNDGWLDGKEGWIPDELTGNKPTKRQLQTAGALLTSPKNWTYDSKGYSVLPNYNQYNTKDEAFAAARNDLGRGASFLYGDTRYTTNYEGEAPNNETQAVLDYVTEGLSAEQKERFMEVYKKAGQPPVSFEKDTAKYSIPVYGVSSWTDVASGRNKSRPHVNLVDRNNSVYINKRSTIEDTRNLLLDELSHNMQIRKDGTGTSLWRFGTDAASGWLNDYDPYHKEGAFEHEAHEKIQPLLLEYVNQGGTFPEFKYGAELPKAQDGGEETSWTDYINPMNWGVTNRDEAGNFKQAFRAARIDGDDEFMWHGERYNTKLAPSPKAKEEPKEEKLFYNKDILKGLSEEQTARRQSLLNAANAVASAQGDDDNLRKLLVMSAVMENTLGADPKAYGRDYTRSPMSIDDVAYNDLFKIREGARGYTAQQKKNASWLEGLGINASDVDSLLRADDPMASMAVARLVYGRAPEALPSGDDPDALYNYYLKYYNKGGVDKYGGAEAHRKKFNDYYNQIYREFGGETDQLKIYKDYVYGVYDGTEMEKSAEKIYDKLNRVYYKEAKKQGMRVPNYIMTNVIKQIDN